MPAQPVFGFLAFTSGSYEGAIIRDMRLANELHRRGFKVVVYWLMETNAELLARGIPQRLLSHGTRYLRRRPSRTLASVGLLTRIANQQRRRRFMQQHPRILQAMMLNFVNNMCDGGNDPQLIRRLGGMLRKDGVTHLLPTFAMICPLALAVKETRLADFEYLVTFQGEEIFANYAESLGRLNDYYAQLRRVADASPWKAVAVSRDYACRLVEEVGLRPEQLVTIYPGIIPPRAREKPPFSVLNSVMPTLQPDIPIVAYLGRQDAEKGIDLLLYAARLLRDRDLPMQLVICGGSSFGWGCQEMCKQIARHLRLRVFWKRRITNDVRDALYAHARCIVYPAIHREPFGMVAAEAMSHGTPVIVPNHGGITEAISSESVYGGLTFDVWNTQDLADKIYQLVTDDALHQTLSGNTRAIAQKFNVVKMTDQVLAHLGRE